MCIVAVSDAQRQTYHNSAPLIIPAPHNSDIIINCVAAFAAKMYGYIDKHGGTNISSHPLVVDLMIRL